MDIAVSVICNAYNHENYIKDALEGFVMQKTDFPFEVLIHDDASTDKTADIIREYERKYPEIIKPIYETENQYSKRDGSLYRIQYGRVKGKYIALCEGDDYWTDPNKLQKQYDALENHPGIDISAHGAYTEKNNEIVGSVEPRKTDDIIPVEELIAHGGGYIATASLMFRAYLSQDPPEFRKMLLLDYTCQVHGALRGGMLYLSEKMCTYRLSTTGSWTERVSTNPKMLADHHHRVAVALKSLNEYTNYQYDNIIQKQITVRDLPLLEYRKEYKKILSPEYRYAFKKLKFKHRLKIRILAICPQTINLISKKQSKQ